MTSDNLDDLCCKFSTTQATGFNRICKVLHLQLERSWLSMIVVIFGLGFESHVLWEDTSMLHRSCVISIAILPLHLNHLETLSRVEITLSVHICSHPCNICLLVLHHITQSNPKQGPYSSPGASRWPVLWGAWQYVALHLPGRSTSNWPHLAAQWWHPKRRSRDCNLRLERCTYHWSVSPLYDFSLMDLWWSCSVLTGLTISSHNTFGCWSIFIFWFLIPYIYLKITVLQLCVSFNSRSKWCKNNI